MKKICVVLALIAAACCSGCSTASNADSVDTTAKVLASNVAIDNTKTRLSSTSLQSMVEELAPALSPSTLVGTWDVTNYPENVTGKVTFNNDGTFTVISGAFRVACPVDGLFTGTWRIIEGSLIEVIPDLSGIIQLNPAVPGGGTAFRNSGGVVGDYYPLPLLFTKSKIILKGLNAVSVLKPTQ
ncbi:DUF5004 domain-containing protein [Pelotalea chapellei]|uniref:Uncharacterized protein n=1 Tax=Pelotalea chapellei TaxID=44671 RepID=A0ABS5U5P9_9BACT|nr:DUF5004 domain-containing protein [Pelotalea chapellei]MBT1070990.1 hypothetical protein [Pelotalea chapellei]